MILKENYEERHIRELQAASKGDPGLIERTMYAFGLLEALAVVGLDFTFKGGTSLLLLLPKPKRLSTDIVSMGMTARKMLLRALIVKMTSKT